MQRTPQCESVSLEGTLVGRRVYSFHSGGKKLEVLFSVLWTALNMSRNGVMISHLIQ